MVALTARERKLFFGDDSGTSLFAGSALCSWPSDGQLTGSQWEDLLRASRPAVVLSGWSTPPLPAPWLESADCPLQYVCHVAGSVRRVVPRSFLVRGGVVTNWGRFAGAFVAEHALLLALAALRNQNAWRSFMTLPPPERIPEQLGTRSLHHRNVGIHGFGNVARALIRLLRPFNVSIRVFSAGMPESMIQSDGVVASTSLEDLFQGSDVLFECEALTAFNERSVSASVLAALPSGAVFVNVGRGRVVDEAALVREAAAGRIRVALDVTSEAVTPDAELFKLPDAILSPHIGGPTHDQYRKCGELARQNIKRFLRREPPEEIVTTEIYDRST